MKTFKFLLLITLAFSMYHVSAQVKPQIIVETDLGGDADDQASLVRLLLYSNDLDIKGIILSRSNDKFQSDGAASNPSNATDALDMANDYINAYGAVRNNLLVHDTDYPSAQSLKDMTKRGWLSEAETHIINVFKNTTGVIWYTNWGCNDGNQSALEKVLDDLQAGSIAGLNYNDVMARLHYVELYSQNHIGNTHRSNVAMYMDTFFPYMDGGRWYHMWNDITSISNWLHDNTNINLTDNYYTTDKEGDTPTWMHLIPNGINIIGHPEYGSWSGRFGWNTNEFTGWWCNQQDTYNGSTNRNNTLIRWGGGSMSEDIKNDFKARAKWATSSTYGAANHQPVVKINGTNGHTVFNKLAMPGTTVSLSAAGTTDPDGDNITYNWVIYNEISDGGSLSNANSESCSVNIPSGFSDGDQIHVYLHAMDDDANIPLVGYGRVIIEYGTDGDENSEPSVSLTAPENNMVFDEGDEITISANASDSDGSISKVEFYQGAIKLGEDVTSPYSYIWTNASPGAYSITVKATDNDGAVSTSISRSITVKVVPVLLAVTASSDITSGDAPLLVNFSGSASGGNSGNGEFIEAGGELVIEAENYSSLTQNGDFTQWEVATSVSGYAESGYIATPDNGLSNGAWGSACEAAYEIDIATAGTYNIWLYKQGVDGAGNSVYVGVDGVQVGSNDNGSIGSWAWYKFGSTTISAGTHTFNIQRREDGYLVDKILLTTSSATPSGNAQTESSQSQSYAYSWTFGDGNTSTQQNPSHTYNSAGNYTAILTVSDGSNTATDDISIVVGDVITFFLTVNSGTGTGSYVESQEVNVCADNSAGCQVFDKWTGDVASLDNVNNACATITMPATNITLTPTYKDIAVSGVALNESSLSVVEGNTVQLTETVSPANACDKSVIWSSSNASVATVNGSGLISAISEGVATITVVSVDGGYSASCEVTINKEVIVNQLITNVSVNSSNSYTWADNLAVGDIYYTDRTYIIKSLPDELAGVEYIKTSNNDKNSGSSDILNFELSKDANVYVAYDSRASSVPTWMFDFELVGWIITTTDVALDIYAKSYAAGAVSLGANKEGGETGAGTNYFVMAVAGGEPIQTYTITFTITDGLSPIAGANVELNGMIQTSDVNGVVIFTNVPQYTDISYTISAVGFQSHTINISVLNDLDKSVVMKYSTTDIDNVNVDVLVYPNPATSMVNISNIRIGSNLSLTNISGQVIYSLQADQSEVQLDISSLRNGMYLFQISNETGVVTKPIVVQ